MNQRAGRNPWWVVVGAVLGLIVGNGPVMQFTFGVFIKPVTAAFGVERGTLSTALLVGLVMTGIATPFVGRAVDRYGIRPIAVPAIVLFSLGMIGIGLGAVSPLVFIALYGLTGLMAAGQTPLTYAKAITRTFDGNRGLALGVAMAGVGLGTALMPKFAQVLIEQFGWRNAYVGLGLLTAAVALPAMLFLVDGGRIAGEVRTVETRSLPGLSVAEAFRSRTFWILIVAFFAVSMAAAGVIAHIVPFMIDRGVPPGKAASVMGVAGLALIGGRLLAGWCLDRVFAPYVAIAFFLMPLLGIVLLLVMKDTTLAVPALLLIGAGLGAEVDLIAYLQSRYLGLKSFGEIYGYLFAVFMLGSGLGPFLMGMGFQKLGSYDVPLYVLCGALLVACVAMLRLGRYVYGVDDARANLAGKAPAGLAH